MNGYKTYTGIFVMLLGFLASKGFIPNAGDVVYTDLVNQIFTVVGAVLAIYGRYDVENRNKSN